MYFYNKLKAEGVHVHVHVQAGGIKDKFMHQNTMYVQIMTWGPEARQVLIRCP